MKFKSLSLALILSCAFVFSAVEAFSQCWYEGSEHYESFYSIFDSKRGNDMEFIKFCYTEGFSEKIDRDTEEYGYYIPNSAAKFGRMEALKFFINEGFRLDDAVDRGAYILCKTPLQLAAENRHYEISKYLLDKGASPIKKDTRNKYDAYDYARQGGSQRVIDLVGAAWRKWKGLAAARTEEYKKEIKNVNMNDYEKFKRMHNLGSFNANSFWGINRA